MRHRYLIAGATFLFVGCSAIADWQRDQGWTKGDRRAWYRATQGSRLMPESWFMAMEQANREEPFSAPSNLQGFGFVAAPAADSNPLPIGFALDQQADDKFVVSGLKWYSDQPFGATTAEKWVGLNCAACHTTQITYQDNAQVIDGGANLLDFQSFIEAIDAAMAVTFSDPAKWSRFQTAVLEGKDTAKNREMLRTEFSKLLDWQIKTDAMNETPMRYGFGRLDAVGHIFNKVLMFNGAEATQGNPANAPVSYPFLWGIWRQEQVQWNGVASNSRFEFPGDSFEYGALGRNTGEVLGVFGEVIITPKTAPGSILSGYESTVQTENLAALELILQELQAPAWPDFFPAIDEDLAAEGKALFASACASCHKTPDIQKAGDKTEVMVSFEEIQANNPEDLTDIWMACNAYLQAGPTGPMRGSSDLNGDRMEEIEPVANMLAVAVRGSLLGDKSSLIKEGFRNFLGIRRPPDIFEADAAEQREADRLECLNTSDQPLLAYKARPLDGIWATAPYLHNGSVASLYEILLPADQRLAEFWVGNREYDPEKVGYVSTPPADNGSAFLFKARDAQDRPIDGNSNAGHEYGARGFSEAQRDALLEYMKTL